MHDIGEEDARPSIIQEYVAVGAVTGATRPASAHHGYVVTFSEPRTGSPAEARTDGALLSAPGH